MGVTKAPAGSPSAADEEIDEAADQAAVVDPEPSTGTDDKAASSADPSKPVGDRAAEKKPTALETLKAKLVATSTEDAEAADAAETAAETPEITEDVEPVVDETPDAATDSGETTPADDDDPLHGFTEKEVKHPSNKGMVTRIRDLAKERKELKAAVQIAEPIKQAGEFLTKFQADNDLTPEESVAALQLSAAFKRADPRALEALETAAAQLRQDLGMPEPTAAPATVEPYRGALPQEYADMVSVLGIPEADVRLMHALVTRHKAAPAAPAQRQAPVARPVQRPAPVQPTRAAVDPRLIAAANETVADFLDMQRVPREKQAEHVQKNLAPFLKPLAPGNDLSRIPAEDRLRLVTIAQQKYAIAQAKARAAARERTPPTLQSTAPVSTPGSTPTAKSPLDKLRAQMVAKR